MSFSSWLRNWIHFAPTTVRRRTQLSPRRPAGFRPRVEVLEDRRVLSGGLLGAMTTHGHGGGGGGSGGGGSTVVTASNARQLISDVSNANTAGGAFTINLKAGATFDLTSENNTTDGGNELPVITGNITIVGNGDTIDRVASYDQNGEPTNAYRLFDVAPGASLTLEDVTLQDGDAGGLSTQVLVHFDGGAVYNQGTLTVSNSTLSDNHAGPGGGIYNAGGTVAINNSTLSGNGYGGPGGGIYNAGGTVAIDNSTLSDNHGLSQGGGIYNAGGMVTVSNNSMLYGNVAEGSNYNAASIEGLGGGVYNSSGTVVIDHSTLSANGADLGGGMYIAGGTVTVGNSSVLSGNQAHAGGGIYNEAGKLTITDSTLSGNVAQVPEGAGLGGGIFVDVGSLTLITNSTLSGNTAQYGGGIYLNGGQLTLSGCTVTQNTAKTYTWATVSETFTGVPTYYTVGGQGGGIYVNGGSLTLRNSFVKNNSPDDIYHG